MGVKTLDLHWSLNTSENTALAATAWYKLWFNIKCFAKSCGLSLFTIASAEAGRHHREILLSLVTYSVVKLLCIQRSQNACLWFADYSGLFPVYKFLL